MLILSHRNVDEESGLSINSNLIVENLVKETIAAKHHQVFNSEGDLQQVEITKTMIQEVMKSHIQYIQCLENQKKEKLVEEITQLKKQKVKAMMKDLKIKQSCFTKEINMK